MLAITGKNEFPMEGVLPQLEEMEAKKASGSELYSAIAVRGRKKEVGGRGKSEQKEKQMQSLEGGKLPDAY